MSDGGRAPGTPTSPFVIDLHPALGVPGRLELVVYAYQPGLARPRPT